MNPSFTPRSSQQKILQYSGGHLGIAAVPGAGKTHILSALAAKIIREKKLGNNQEILIVTLVNSAVDNFKTRIEALFENPLHALYKYRVRTLHGLAHDIVREKPGSVGLDNQFSIIDEREAGFIRREAVNSWLASHSLDEYLDPALEFSKRDWVKRHHLPDLLDSISLAFIRSAKDRLLTPEVLKAKLDQYPSPLPLAELGCAIYGDYQRALSYRGAVDFDDLIRFALVILENDRDYLARLQHRYPYILEDEAQDSSQTQERILSLISGGNWVRVGDPNQAIFETFTTASPELLRAFIQNNPSVDMPESGRSQQAIIDTANKLIEWVNSAHPDPEARSALSSPIIIPAPAGDPQQNPPSDPEAVKFIGKKFTPEEEVDAVAKAVKSYLDTFSETPVEERPTIAILVPRNARGVDVVNELRKRGIDPLELISSTSETRAAAGSLSHLLAYLSDPGSARKLSRAYEVWRRDWREMPSPSLRGGPATKQSLDEANKAETAEILKQTKILLSRMDDVEKFIAPINAEDWLSGLGESEAEQVIQELGEFRIIVRRWLDAVSLPIDQLMLTLAQDIFNAASDLALAHKLALVLRSAADDHADWRLPELTSELALIAKNQRKFIGFSEDDAGFNPERHRGRVVVATMHKAKGLEWDRVYLMSLNNYDFPSNMPGDRFISERWFARGRLNLEAESLAQLDALESSGEFAIYEEGAATKSARLGYVKERLRLFYVGITRAKKDLIVTWNSGRQGEAVLCQPAAWLSGGS